MKLLGISVFIVFSAFALWVMAAFFAGPQTYTPYDHPLMKLKSPSVALQADSLKSASEFISQDPSHGILLKLHFSRDGQLFTATPSAFDFLKKLATENSMEFKGLKIHQYEYDFIKSQTEQTIPLKAWMILSPAFWIFDVQDNAVDVDRYVVETVEAEKLEKKVIIRSSTDLVVSSLKKRKPLWIYGSSQSDNTVMLTMASAYLEGLPRFERDYYFTELTYRNRNIINDRVLNEVRKRQKKIAIGPVENLEEKNKALALSPDVLIIKENLLDTQSQE
jgi:hypothetical protein